MRRESMADIYKRLTGVNPAGVVELHEVLNVVVPEIVRLEVERQVSK